MVYRWLLTKIYVLKRRKIRQRDLKRQLKADMFNARVSLQQPVLSRSSLFTGFIFKYSNSGDSPSRLCQPSISVDRRRNIANLRLILSLNIEDGPTQIFELKRQRDITIIAVCLNNFLTVNRHIGQNKEHTNMVMDLHKNNE